MPPWKSSWGILPVKPWGWGCEWFQGKQLLDTMLPCSHAQPPPIPTLIFAPIALSNPTAITAGNSASAENVRDTTAGGRLSGCLWQWNTVGVYVWTVSIVQQHGCNGNQYLHKT